MVPEDQKPWFARHAPLQIPKGTKDIDQLFKQAKALMEKVDLAYPLVIKPDIGQRGAGVQRIFDDEQLRTYIETLSFRLYYAHTGTY